IVERHEKLRLMLQPAFHHASKRSHPIFLVWVVLTICCRRIVQPAYRGLDRHAMPQQAPHALPPRNVNGAVTGAPVTHGGKSLFDVDGRLACPARTEPT